MVGHLMMAFFLGLSIGNRALINQGFMANNSNYFTDGITCNKVLFFVKKSFSISLLFLFVLRCLVADFA